MSTGRGKSEGLLQRFSAMGGLLGAGGEHSEGHDSACAFLLQLSARGNPAAASAASWGGMQAGEVRLGVIFACYKQ